MSPLSRLLCSASLLLVLLMLGPRSAAAQAWVSYKQSLSAAVDYSYAPSDRIIDDFSTRDEVLNRDPISNHSIVLSAEYVPIDNLGLSVSIPFVITHYDLDGGGDRQGFLARPHGRYDDGDYHGVLQDFKFQARYMVLEEPLAISPHIGVSIPMTDYETQGFASAGRGLMQLHLGASLGKFFTSGVPGLYLHGSYEFRLVERYETGFSQTEDFSQNRSDIKMQVGYYILDNLEAHLAGDLQLAHGGFQFRDWMTGSNEQLPTQFFHDALIAEEFFHLGGGLSYGITESVSVNAFVRIWLWGQNTRDAHAFGAGASWDIM